MSRNSWDSVLLAVMQARVGNANWNKEVWITERTGIRFSLAVDELNNSKIAIDDTPGISIMEMRNKENRKCKRLSRGWIWLWSLQLQLMRFWWESRPCGSRNQFHLRESKTLAREMDCLTNCSFAAFRAVGTKAGSETDRPTWRESGSIEQGWMT